MPNITIPNLPPVISLSGSEQIEVVQAGTSSRATIAQIGAVFSTYTAGTGLTLSNSQFSIANTTVTAGSYTLSNFTVNTRGQITAASSAATTGSGSVVLAASPTLVTPILGNASASTLSVTSTTSTTPSLTFNASNSNIFAGAMVSGSYLQHLLQNSSNTANASTNFVLSNDLGTDSSYYGEFGMNSSTFSASTPSDFFSINNGIYYSGHDGDISVGSGNGYKLYFPWGATGASAHVINASGAIGLSTNLGTTPALSGATGFGTAGQVLTSQGASSAPTWATVGRVTTASTSYTETATAGIKIVIINGSSVNITLPTAVANTAILTYKLAVSGTLTLTATGGQLIDDGSTASTSVRYSSITIASDNSNWWVI